LTAFDGFAVRTGDIGSFRALLSFNDVKFHFLLVTQTAQILIRIIFRNGRLMHENVFVGIDSIDKTVSVLDVEPFHFSFHARSQNFLFNRLFGRRRFATSGIFIGHFRLISIEISRKRF
jgi:hypothetical protein